MPYTATVTVNNVVLPDGHLHQSGDTVTISDADYAQMGPTLVAAVLSGLTVTSTDLIAGGASGAPTSGTYAAKSVVVNADGSMYACTVAGTPGTWVAIGGGGSGAMTKIGSVVVASTQPTMLINVASASAYNALHGVYTGRNDSGLTNVACRFNADSGTNYTWSGVQSTGSLFGVGAGASGYLRLSAAASSSATAHYFGAGQFTVPQPGGGQFKLLSACGVGVDGQTYFEEDGGQWNSTAAITSVTLSLVNGTNFVAGSSFALYGLS